MHQHSLSQIGIYYPGRDSGRGGVDGEQGALLEPECQAQVILRLNGKRWFRNPNLLTILSFVFGGGGQWGVEIELRGL